jgi:putative ABC transport system ATP-binding protein
VIELRSVTKTYEMGDEVVHALDDVDLSIGRGEFVAVVGPSGSGKSTLANIVGGLDRPDSGEVSVGGMSLARVSDKQLSAYRNASIGFVFQSFNLQAHFTARENVALPLMFAGVPKKQRLAKAEEALRAVGLDDRMEHKPSQLSGGQRQRVSIARALVNSPDIVIADEPTGSVDSKRSEEIMALLTDLNRARGLTLVVITHDLTIAEQARRVLHIRDGRVEEGAGLGIARPARARKVAG